MPYGDIYRSFTHIFIINLILPLIHTHLYIFHILPHIHTHIVYAVAIGAIAVVASAEGAEAIGVLSIVVAVAIGGMRYGMHLALYSFRNFLVFVMDFKSFFSSFHFLAPEIFRDFAAMSVSWSSNIILVELLRVILSLRVENCL